MSKMCSYETISDPIFTYQHLVHRWEPHPLKNKQLLNLTVLVHDKKFLPESTELVEQLSLSSPGTVSFVVVSISIIYCWLADQHLLRLILLEIVLVLGTVSGLRSPFSQDCSLHFLIMFLSLGGSISLCRVTVPMIQPDCVTYWRHKTLYWYRTRLWRRIVLWHSTVLHLTWTLMGVVYVELSG